MANLLDEASILLTPTAYDNGSMLAVKPENGDGDFTFSRNSAATRVNAQGLVENVQILSSNLVSNGDFSQEGSELVTNGNFATDTDWITNDWNISGGYLNGSASTGVAFQNFSGVVVGKTYKATITVESYTSGILRFKVGNDSYQNISSNLGIQEFYFTASSTGGIVIVPNSAYTGSITNISVKELGQDWTLGTGWSIGDSKVDAINAAFGSSFTQNMTVVPNRKYKVSFDVSDYVKGNVRIQIGNTSSSEVSSNGSFTFFLTSFNSAIVKIETRAGGSGTTLSIDNISVIEITDDTNLPRINYEGFSYQDSLGSELIVNGDFATDTNWNTASNWTISNGSANADGSSSGLLNQTTIPTVVGKTYKVEYTILNYVSGSVRFGYGGVSESFRTSNGTYTSYRLATNTNSTFSSSSINFIGSIDNVSVKEYLGQEVVPSSGCGHWLMEPQSTNLITQSELFSDASWIKHTGIVLTSNQASPDGGNNAYKVQGTIGSSYILDGGFGAITPQSRSIYMRADTNGVVYSLGDSQSNQINVTTEWQRFELQEVSNTIYAVDFRGSGVTLDTVYIWGAQLEQNSFATSLIPTQGAISTRLQDIATNSGNASLINSEQGVLYAEISALADDLTSRVITISDGTALNRVSLEYWIATNRVVFRLFSGGNEEVLGLYDVDDITENKKVAITWSGDSITPSNGYFKAYIDGNEVYSKEGLLTFPVDTLNILDFSYATNNSSPFYGKIKALAVYKTALTDAELTLLTTI